MLDLPKLHLSTALTLADRRVRLLQQPVAHREAIQHLDWSLQASLGIILRDKPELPPPRRVNAAFIQAWVLLQQSDLLAGLQQLQALYTAEISNVRQIEALNAALRCSALDIDTQEWSELDEFFCMHLVHHARTIAPDLLTHWLSSDSDALRAAALQRLSNKSIESDRLQSLIDSHDFPLTRLVALALGAMQQQPFALSLLPLLSDEEAMSHLPLALLAAWLNPDVFISRRPELAALTGRIGCIPDLLDTMECPAEARNAAIAWFWLTGKRLPHKLPINPVEHPHRHVSPNSSSLPDVQYARQWWQQYGWSDNHQRYFLGQPVNLSNLRHLYASLAGQVAPLLCTHLSNAMGRTVNEPYGFWLKLPEVEHAT